jgi:polar amino acid transport system substrate-binding protein
VRTLLSLLVVCVFASVQPLGAQRELLRWGGDAEGGAPFVEADPNDPSRLVGFDVDVARIIASGLGREPRFVQVGFTSLEASAARGDFDIGLSGVEDTPARRARLAVTIPYYEFREVLTVRKGDANRFRSLSDLRGHRVATLGATLAYDILLKAESDYAIVPVTYEDDVHPYSDLALGRVDAVLLDQVLAERGVRRDASLTNSNDRIAVGHYVGILARENRALRDRIDDVLRSAMRDGQLEAVFRRWGVWNEDQARLYASLTGGTSGASTDPSTGSGSSPAQSRDDKAGPTGPADQPRPAAAVVDAWAAARRYAPAMIRATGVTLVLSCLAMALAVAVGGLIAAGRVYGGAPLRIVLTGYVEIMRGTPLLLQLFVIYFGLASIIELPAFVAAMAGLALNYAAYESEIYRGALLAVPAGQLEAAQTLGLSTRQTLWLIRGPQAFRLALPPMTNDFVALLKDSSLVSVITVVELTKQTSIFAANIGSWVVPGAFCAALYLVLSLPLAHAARRLERSWRRA